MARASEIKKPVDPEVKKDIMLCPGFALSRKLAKHLHNSYSDKDKGVSEIQVRSKQTSREPKILSNTTSHRQKRATDDGQCLRIDRERECQCSARGA